MKWVVLLIFVSAVIVWFIELGKMSDAPIRAFFLCLHWV